MASSPPQTERPDFDDAARAAEMVEYDHFIDEQIEKTSAQVRWVDISAALMTLAAGWLGFLLVASLVDHWVVSGGLGHVARFACFSALVGGTVMFSIWRIVPLVVRRINPVYAAHVIEREEPSLKNSLVNFLLLRATPRHLTRKTYQALEESAAHGLADVPVEHIVDRSHVLKVGYVLMAVIVAGCVYKLVSPKDPLRSVGRIVIPWSDLTPASRVTIEDVEPGSTAVFHGQSIDVSAVVSGAGDDEPVSVIYSTSDTRVVDRPIVMQRPEGSFRHQATLPEEVDGFEQDVEYYIAAGDARTATYRVTVSTPPAVVVESVQYSYPAYTGLGTRTVKGGGDLKAIEGTRVTIRARANRDIDDAFVDFECDGRTDLMMAVEADDRHATSTFTLEMTDDSVTPTHTSYQLRFSGADGQENPRPTRHRIEVLPDTPPEVHFELPGYDGVEVPENAAVRLEVRAEDSDFSLGEVTLFAQHKGKQIAQHRLLGEPHAGEFVGHYDFRPGKYRLRAGDELMYWAEARDLRQPVANRAETVRYQMLIVEPSSAPPPEQTGDEPQDQSSDADDESDGESEEPGESSEGSDDGAGEDASDEDASDEESADEVGADGEDSDEEDDEREGGQESGDDGQPSEADAGHKGAESGDSGGQREGDQGVAGEDGKPGEREAGEQDGDEGAGEPIDPTSNPGDAFEEILRHREETLDVGEDSDAGGESPGSDPQGSDSRPEKGDENKALGDNTPGEDGTDGDTDDERGSEPSERDQAGQRDGDTDNGQSQQQQDGDTQARQQPQQQPQDGQPQEGQPGDDDSQDGASDQASGQPGESNNADKPNGQEQDAGEEMGGNEQDSADEPGSSGKPTSDGQSPGDGQQQDPSAGREDQEGSTVENSDRDDPAGSQTQSQKPSEAQGGQQGDRSGSGQQGSGQKADQPGTGGAGQNTAADEGGSASEQHGDGPTGQKPGEKPGQPGQGGKQQSGKGGSDGPSDVHEDGQKSGGNQQGEQQQGGGQEGGGQEGEQQPGANQPGGQQQGGQPPGSQQPGGKPGQPGEGAQGQGKSGQGGSGQGTPAAGQPGSSSGGSTGGTPAEGSDAGAQPNESLEPNDQQGNGRGGGERESSPDDPPPRDGDAAALEQQQRLAKAREATNLALEHLRDQLAREKPDQRLLDRLGWTRDQMQRFLARWEEMNRAAVRPGEEGERAQNRLDRMLRGLGVSPRARKLGSGGVGDDSRRDLTSPRRVAPPRQYADQFEAYTEGAAKGREKD